MNAKLGAFINLLWLPDAFVSYCVLGFSSTGFNPTLDWWQHHRLLHCPDCAVGRQLWASMGHFPPMPPPTSKYTSFQTADILHFICMSKSDGDRISLSVLLKHWNLPSVRMNTRKRAICFALGSSGGVCDPQKWPWSTLVVLLRKSLHLFCAAQVLLFFSQNWKLWNSFGLCILLVVVVANLILFLDMVTNLGVLESCLTLMVAVRKCRETKGILTVSSLLPNMRLSASVFHTLITTLCAWAGLFYPSNDKSWQWTLTAFPHSVSLQERTCENTVVKILYCFFSLWANS